MFGSHGHGYYTFFRSCSLNLRARNYKSPRFRRSPARSSRRRSLGAFPPKIVKKQILIKNKIELNAVRARYLTG